MIDEKPVKKRKISFNKSSQDVSTKEHLPKFTIKPGTQSRLISDIPNLMLWIFSEKLGKMPSWIFVQVRAKQNKHLITQVIIIFVPGLDLYTLNEYSSAPFLSSLAIPSLCTLLHPKCKIPYTLLFKAKKVAEQPKLTLSDYILNQEELIENGFVFDNNFKCTANKYAESSMAVVGLDCEMVMCVDGLQLARVTVVNKDFEVVYDEYIKPGSEITDYLTKYSGITEDLISCAALTAFEAREQILKIIGQDTVICGHSLENDLLQLKIAHYKVIDTSVIFPHPVPGYKHSLKTLAMKYLKKRIQAVLST
jgi:RNA exonuclease 1